MKVLHIRNGIVSIMLSLSQNIVRRLFMETIAEGIETDAQLDFFRQHSCRQVQGFLFSPAVPADQITARLLEQKKAR